MMVFHDNTPIFLALDHVDFRAGINRLVRISTDLFEANPRESGLYLFRNRRRTDIKFIYYHRNGYFLGHKRLSRGKLKWWPRTHEEAARLSADQVESLLRGEDPRLFAASDDRRIESEERAQFQRHFEFEGAYQCQRSIGIQATQRF